MSLLRRLGAEATGSLLLAATVIGSGIMAERLARGNAALALLANTGATVAVLATLVALFAPVSGAHFNLAVSLVQALRRALAWREAGGYVAAQVLGCCAGAVLAREMFGLPWIQVSGHARAGVLQWLAEFVATSGLLLVVLGHRRARDAPWMVAVCVTQIATSARPAATAELRIMRLPAARFEAPAKSRSRS
jgi:glycerol uptake facilitator-like aquaporin